MWECKQSTTNVLGRVTDIFAQMLYTIAVIIANQAAMASTVTLMVKEENEGWRLEQSRQVDWLHFLVFGQFTSLPAQPQAIIVATVNLLPHILCWSNTFSLPDLKRSSQDLWKDINTGGEQMTTRWWVKQFGWLRRQAIIVATVNLLPHILSLTTTFSRKDPLPSSWDL